MDSAFVRRTNLEAGVEAHGQLKPTNPFSVTPAQVLSLDHNFRHQENPGQSVLSDQVVNLVLAQKVEPDPTFV